jgi:ABC-type transport system substrate-binding protein
MSKLATTGASDVDFSVGPQDAFLVALAEKVRSDPSLGSVHIASADFVRFISMNLAVPPFDDVHVRRALNLVINKQRLLGIRGGPSSAAVAGHIAFDSLEDNLLLSYKPYGTPNDGGDLERAKHEMSLSRYDSNHDGVCDAAACRDIVGLVTAFGWGAPIGREIARQVDSLGIHIRVKVEDTGAVYGQISDPKTHAAIALTLGWGKDYLNASSFILPLFSRDQLGGPNHSLLGATPAQLRGWGYKVTSTPSIDDRIEYCLRLVGQEQIRCWSSLDQYLTEQVVPWVPLFFDTNIVITSPRVVAFSYDQYAIQPSLDRLALKPGSSTP